MTPGPLRTVRRRLGRVRRLVAALSVAELVEVVRVLTEPAARRRERLARLALGPSGRLVFVCYGNIMRSAFAAAWVQARHPALAAYTVGAGTHARDGRAAQDDAIVVAAEFGIALEGHRATRLDALGLGPGDVIVGMDLEHVGIARRLAGVDPARVFLIGDAAEVPVMAGGVTVETPGHGTTDDAPPPVTEPARPSRVVEDPYGLGIPVTRSAFARIRRHADAFARHLAASVPHRAPSHGRHDA